MEEKAGKEEAESTVAVEEGRTVTADGVRNSMYEQYRHELDAIWRNSRFSWTFEAVLFGAFGVLLQQAISTAQENAFILHVILIVLTMLGLLTSVVWIALAKASKLWQEWYESRITKFEHDRNLFRFSREFAMGGSTNRIAEVDNHLRSNKCGLFSPGRITIFIAQFVWLIWFLVIVAQHFYFIVNRKIELPNAFVSLIVCGIVYFWFIWVFKRSVCNDYIRSEDYRGEYIFETYSRLEDSIERLGLISHDAKSLRDYVMNDYCGISWSLFKIWEAQGVYNSFEDWLDEPYEKLKEEFCMGYISGEYSTSQKCNVFIEKLQSQIRFEEGLIKGLFL